MARNTFAVLTSPQQALIGTGRAAYGAMQEEGQPLPYRTGKAALSAQALSFFPLVPTIGNAVYGDENFNSAWEQSFAGQMRAAGGDTGEGWFPGGKTAELQAKSVLLWSRGTWTSRSGRWECSRLTCSGWTQRLPPTIPCPEPLTPLLPFCSIRRSSSARPHCPANSLLRPGGGSRRRSSRVLRGLPSDRVDYSPWVEPGASNGPGCKKRAEEVATARAVAEGQSPEQARYAVQLIDYIAHAREGGATERPLSEQFAEDLDIAGMRGMVKAAEDHVAQYDAQGAIPSLDDQIRMTRKDKLAAVRGLADDIEVPAGLTGADADFYRAYTTMFRNKSLMEAYHAHATELTENAAHLRRPEFEQEFVNTYIADVGEQLDLAASSKMNDIGFDLQADPTMADAVIRQTLDDIEEVQGMNASDARAALDGIVQESRYGPLPESIYTLSEPNSMGTILGRVNGEDALVQLKDPERVKGVDEIIESAHQIVTGEKKGTAARIKAVNKDLMERLNIDGDVVIAEGGKLQPKDISQPVNYQHLLSMLYDADGNMLTGVDLMSALLRLINAEPQFKRNLAFAPDYVPTDIAMAARRVLLEVADSIGKDVNKVVKKHMTKALADIGNKDLTVGRIREDILGMTDLRTVIESTLGRIIDEGGEISYGELLALAGRVGGHGKLADELARSGIQGIRGLSEEGIGIWWADRSVISAGAFDLDEVLGGNPASVTPLKHNDPAYMLVGREAGRLQGPDDRRGPEKGTVRSAEGTCCVFRQHQNRCAECC